MPRAPAIVFQPPNSVGLGHLSRLTAIALALKAIDPSVRVPFVVEGSSHMFLESHGLPYLSLPSPNTVYKSPCWAMWSPQERLSAMVSISRTMIRELRADAVVFDSFPSLPFSIAAVQSRVALVLCLRRMRNLNDYLTIVADLLPHLQLILVAEEPGTFEFPEPLKHRTEFIGPIMRRGDGANGVPMTTPVGRRVVITGGGGGFPGTVDFYNLSLRAFARLRSRVPELTGVLITGPLFTDWLRLELVDGVRVLPFAANMTAYLVSADVIVSQCGYNMMQEVAHLGRQTICIPAPRDSDDQFDRASRMAADHSHISLFLGSAEVELTHLMATCLSKPHGLTTAQGADGAHIAAERVYKLIIEKRTHRETTRLRELPLQRQT